MIKQNQRVMTRAHIIAEASRPCSLSEALKKAWYFERFRGILRNGYARFSFYKKDGTIRYAKGTLCGSLIPDEDVPDQSEKVADKKENCGIIVYYDINKKAWRSFRVNEFIGVSTAWEMRILDFRI